MVSKLFDNGVLNSSKKGSTRTIKGAICHVKSMMSRESSNKLYSLLSVAFLLIGFSLNAYTQNNVTYFVPLPEQDVRSNFKVFTDDANGKISDDMISIISIVTIEDGARIIYDHWEDGYEVDINNPVQSTTEIWGDSLSGN
jgi:hypothetical protein